MLHRTCWGWMRRHPFTSWAVGGIVLALLPIAYIVFIFHAHRYLIGISGAELIATVIGAQYDWIKGNLLVALVAVAWMLFWGSAAIVSTVCGAVNGILAIVAPGRQSKG